MTVTRKTETTLASAQVSDDEMNGAYAVVLQVNFPVVGTLARSLDAIEAEQLGHELIAAASEAINMHRTDNPPPTDAFDAAAATGRYVWVTATHRVRGLGLWDKQEERVAWFDIMPNETDRMVIGTNLRSGRDDMYTWWPADTVRPFEIAVFA